jgi:hypothetical protein
MSKVGLAVIIWSAKLIPNPMSNEVDAPVVDENSTASFNVYESSCPPPEKLIAEYDSASLPSFSHRDWQNVAAAASHPRGSTIKEYDRHGNWLATRHTDVVGHLADFLAQFLA